jgi:hypothetical protein
MERYKLLPGNTESCTCSPEDKCPLGKPSTSPRCTIDDLEKEAIRRQKIARIHALKLLEQIDLKTSYHHNDGGEP